MRVGDYEILRRIGHGAYGKVYLARRGDPGGFRTYYALKRLRMEHAGEEDFERYLLREARHGGLVNHRSLVRIHGVLRWEGEFVLVMDFVEGVSLRQILAPRRADGEPLPREVAMEIAAETLEALNYIHTLVDPEGRESGFVHRDVKPGNIMLTPAGGLKLMDFGVARGDDVEVATQAGELRGTIAYMAPEQAAGQPAGPAADQFAAGLVLLEMLAATPAWGDPKGTGILGKVMEGDVSEGLVRLDATDPVCQILIRMLQPEPSDRFPSSGAAAGALRGLRALVPSPPALPAFAHGEVARVRGGAELMGPAPSWTDSEGSDPVGSSGTWSRLSAPATGMSDSGGSGGGPVHTLPLGRKAVRAMDIQAEVESLDLDEEEPTEQAPPRPPPPPPPSTSPRAWTGDLAGVRAWPGDLTADSGGGAVGAAPTAPLHSGPRPSAPPPSVPPPPPAPPLSAAGSATVPLRTPSPVAIPPGASATHWTERTLPWSGQGQPPEPPRRAAPPPPIPGGPLPPLRPGPATPHRGLDGLPRRRSGGVEVASSPLLTAGLALLALLMVAGITGAAWLALKGEPDSAPVDPIDGMALPSSPTPTALPAIPPREEELPGSASIEAMEIVDADPEEGATPGLDRREAASQLRELGGALPFSEREGDRSAPVETPAGRIPESADERPAPGADPTPEADRGSREGDDGALLDHERREVEAGEEEALREGMIVGDRPRTREGREVEVRTVDDRRTAEEQARAVGGTTGRAPPEPTASAAPVEAASNLPSLRFLSAGVQPLGVPLSLRVRPENFLASSVSVYYQWRGQGQGGRRKRALRPQSDGSFALDIQSSELQADRLQLWFVAEPGSVRAGTASNPIEVKVR